ncbi:LamB/YcsF family protein [Caldalkalibacillus mannanilyticus]|uniref:LamB/YcsF family protein n=1 Tax=Caldalkalibacillus mannanilyticus TaxID=1418 RepID=UPI00046939DB|nr:5-oxoprolinase subunit PxpA [Caldalkalibacillus mannanilyticus]
MKVDLNCDMGESFGAYTMGQDEKVLPFITSANIACGYHAGDPSVMAKTIAMCLQQNISIGAHPGYPDLVGFGRRALQVSPQEVYHMVLYQVGALQSMTRAFGGIMSHVKPHGALYNTAAKDAVIAQAIAQAVYHVAPEAILFGLANSELVKAGENIGLVTAHEVFADRTYQKDGSLTPRTHPQAVIHEVDMAIKQVIQMVQEKKVASIEGMELTLKADTICIHGDSPNAPEFAEKLSKALHHASIEVESLTKWKD